MRTTPVDTLVSVGSITSISSTAPSVVSVPSAFENDRVMNESSPLTGRLKTVIVSMISDELVPSNRTPPEPLAVCWMT